MNLRELAVADHRLLVEDAADGFGRELKFTDPDGRTEVVNGQWNDIGQSFDPIAGTVVAGTTVFVHVTLGALRDAGLGIPVGVADDKQKPWRVEFTDMGGKLRRFKIREVHKDRSFDAVNCYLEKYK